jgi:hypothetical protein
MVPAEEIGITANIWETKEEGAGDFFPELTMDGDQSPGSSWRGERVDGVKPWIQYDLGSVRHVDRVRMCFLKGDERNYQIDVSVSTDGESWTSVFNGQTSGATLELEDYPVNADGRYVRITGDGNSHPEFFDWTNIVEMEIYCS